jgi:hypothetical protein
MIEDSGHECAATRPLGLIVERPLNTPLRSDLVAAAHKRAEHIKMLRNIIDRQLDADDLPEPDNERIITALTHLSYAARELQRIKG